MPIKVTNVFFDPGASGVLTLTGGAASWTDSPVILSIGQEYGAMVLGFISNAASGTFTESAWLSFHCRFIGESGGYFQFGRLRGGNTANDIVYGCFEVPYGVSEIKAVAKRGSGTATFHGLYSYNDTK